MTEDDDLDEAFGAPRGPGISPEDYDLLSLAALAIGCEDVELVDGEQYVNLHFPDGSIIHAWNPKRHSDDALDLAVWLELDIMHRAVGGRRVEVLVAGGRPTNVQVYGDALATTRMAITAAAAQIGKAKNA